MSAPSQAKSLLDCPLEVQTKIYSYLSSQDILRCVVSSDSIAGAGGVVALYSSLLFENESHYKNFFFFNRTTLPLPSQLKLGRMFDPAHIKNITIFLADEPSYSIYNNIRPFPNAPLRIQNLTVSYVLPLEQRAFHLNELFPSLSPRFLTLRSYPDSMVQLPVTSVYLGGNDFEHLRNWNAIEKLNLVGHFPIVSIERFPLEAQALLNNFGRHLRAISLDFGPSTSDLGVPILNSFCRMGLLRLGTLGQGSVEVVFRMGSRSSRGARDWFSGLNLAEREKVVLRSLP